LLVIAITAFHNLNKKLATSITNKQKKGWDILMLVLRKKEVGTVFILKIVTRLMGAVAQIGDKLQLMKSDS
jgi:hypothetical protein